MSYTKNRRLALSRDQYKCTKCGQTDNLHAHHIKARWDGGSDALDNLTMLCQECHYDLHAKEDREHAEEMDQIGQAQYEALKQCESEFYEAHGIPAPLAPDKFADFSRGWPGWASVPKYP